MVVAFGALNRGRRGERATAGEVGNAFAVGGQIQLDVLTLAQHVSDVKTILAIPKKLMYP